MHHQQKKRNFCISRRQLKVIKDWTFFIWLTTMKPFYARFLVLIRTWTKLTSLDFCGQRPSKFTFFLRSFSKDKLHEVLRRELKFPFVQNSNIPTKLKNFRQTLNRLYELKLFFKKICTYFFGCAFKIFCLSTKSWTFSEDVEDNFVLVIFPRFSSSSRRPRAEDSKARRLSARKIYLIRQNILSINFSSFRHVLNRFFE